VWLVKSAPWSLLVNKFAVLDIEEVNTEIREPINAPPLFPSALVRTALPRRPKWEKKLPRRLSTNTLDARRTSIVLPIEIGTVTNFIWPYLHQFFINSHGLNGYGKPLKRPFYRYQSRLEAINNGQDIRQINW